MNSDFEIDHFNLKFGFEIIVFQILVRNVSSGTLKSDFIRIRFNGILNAFRI